jgi:hypothetical protein
MPRPVPPCWSPLVPLPLLVVLATCGPIEPHGTVAGIATAPHLIAAGAAVTVGSVAVIGRTPIDALVSVVSGKDCSAVRLEQGKSYCRPTEPLPDAPSYCTRSLGVVDCWRDPSAVVDLAPEVADGPRVLNAAQEANRIRRWPDW